MVNQIEAQKWVTRNRRSNQLVMEAQNERETEERKVFKLFSYEYSLQACRGQGRPFMYSRPDVVDRVGSLPFVLAMLSRRHVRFIEQNPSLLERKSKLTGSFPTR